MNKQIKFLIKVQEIDKQLQELEKIREGLPSKVNACRREIETKKDDQKKMEVKDEELHKNLRSLQGKLQLIDDALKKHQTQIYSVKNEKEMNALDHEIKKDKQERRNIEDEILNIEIVLEELEPGIKRGKTLLVEEDSKLAKEEEIYRKEMEENGEKTSTLSQEREKITSEIQPDVISLYKKLMSNKNNLAVVPINGIVCQGCFMSLPPQIMNEVRIKEMVTCEHCLRILYLSEEKDKEVRSEK